VSFEKVDKLVRAADVVLRHHPLDFEGLQKLCQRKSRTLRHFIDVRAGARPRRTRWRADAARL
jgi:hypothetical protein